MTFEKIIANIDSLPPLSNAAYIIESMYRSGIDNINILRLVKVIESDAMLAANILKMINAPYYGFQNKIASVSQAVSLFGTKRIYGLIMQYAMRENLKADTSIYGFEESQFNDLCQLQSTLLMQWYSRIELRDAQFLSSLALIMESGKLVIAQEVVRSDYCGEFRKAYNECESIEAYEKSLMDITSYEITALLFKHWKLEPLYIDILEALDNQEKYAKLDVKVQNYVDEVDVIRTAINAKDILSDSAIDKAAHKVMGMGQKAQLFKDIAYRVRETYLNSLDT
jgi:HD-like signal output (HDOD) protein